MQSYPLTKILNTSGQYFIIPLDTKCIVHNTVLQIDTINNSGTLQYKVDRTVWPVNQAIYPTFNTSEDVLNAQAKWIGWVDPGSDSQLLQNTIPVKALRVTLITAGDEDSIIIHLVQQGVI